MFGAARLELENDVTHVHSRNAPAVMTFGALLACLLGAPVFFKWTAHAVC